MIITNIDTVPGRKISKILGIVRGSVVGSKPISESFFSGLKEAMLSAVALAPRIITGEEVGLVPKDEMRQKEEKEIPAAAANDLEDYSCLLTRLRDTALSRMIDNGKERGADAVIKVCFDVSVISVRVVEVCAYGTAVKLD
ncbi:MAG: heavy metal-binding domain-containing protein [Candidatus Erginobacter occultus]|nr:heavy metal-binding domain-containing protein [Candidatus Erginobacter occultus]